MTLDRLLAAVREARHGTIALTQGLATLLALGILPAPYDRWAGAAIAVLAAAGIAVVPNSKPTPLAFSFSRPDWTPVQQISPGGAVSPQGLEDALTSWQGIPLEPHPAPLAADETEPRTLP